MYAIWKNDLRSLIQLASEEEYGYILPKSYLELIAREAENKFLEQYNIEINVRNMMILNEILIEDEYREDIVAEVTKILKEYHNLFKPAKEFDFMKLMRGSVKEIEFYLNVIKKYPEEMIKEAYNTAKCMQLEDIDTECADDRDFTLLRVLTIKDLLIEFLNCLEALIEGKDRKMFCKDENADALKAVSIRFNDARRFIDSNNTELQELYRELSLLAIQIYEEYPNQLFGIPSFKVEKETKKIDEVEKETKTPKKIYEYLVLFLIEGCIGRTFIVRDKEIDSPDDIVGLDELVKEEMKKTNKKGANTAFVTDYKLLRTYEE